MLSVEPHPLLDLGAFITTFPSALSNHKSTPAIANLLSPQSPAPLQCDDTVKAIIRSLLRHGGFKPTGRSKPASEYLIGAADRQALTCINLAVDIANCVSLHSGLPISVVDLDLIAPPLRIAIAVAGSEYVFNASGQVIDVEGLICLHDALGPCANAVKDAQRTKTHDATTRTLSLVWGSNQLPGRTHQTVHWYRSLLEESGMETSAPPNG